MSNESSEPKQVHMRVSLGGDAPTPTRRSGHALARPGHFLAAPCNPDTEHATPQKTSQRAVRAEPGTSVDSEKKG
jgi:hypothetical protein